MTEIVDVKGREIIDSRGNRTVGADVTLACGAMGRAPVPSGASTATLDALELINIPAKRYVSKGATTAVTNVNATIAKGILSMDIFGRSHADTGEMVHDQLIVHHGSKCRFDQRVSAKNGRAL